MMRDVAWGFFYGTVNFDNVLGTINHYGTVGNVCRRLKNSAYFEAGLAYVGTFDSKVLRKAFEDILGDWTNEGFDPFAAPEETGKATGRRRGENLAAIQQQRVVAKANGGTAGRRRVSD